MAGQCFRVLSRELFAPSPRSGTGALAASYYTRPSGGDLASVQYYISRSDTLDDGVLRLSGDNGRSWGPCQPWPTRFDHPLGVQRRDTPVGLADPANGRFILMFNENVLGHDEYTECLRTGTLRYRVSADGGETWDVDEPIVHEGAEFSAEHPLPGVTFGKNCVMFGDLTDRPVIRPDGVILVPVQSSPVGPSGHYEPGESYSFTDCLVLMARWRPDGRLAWTASERIRGEVSRSSRGWIEPTLAFQADGSLLMLMRGSNDRHVEMGGHRWASRSRDGGQTWSSPRAWTYDDGQAFFSPSSCSQLIPCADGRLLWMGNICPHNTRGNGPRYPLVLGQVDLASGLLIRDSVTVIDDRQVGESQHLTLSNFLVRQDRESGQLLLHLSRFFPRDFGEWPKDWTADAMLYRIEI